MKILSIQKENWVPDIKQKPAVGCFPRKWTCLLAKDWSLCDFFSPLFLTCEMQTFPGISYMGLLFKYCISSGVEGHSLCSSHLNLGFWQSLTVVETLALGHGGSGELSRASPIHPSWRSLLSSQVDILWSPLFVKADKGACGLWCLCCWMTRSGVLIILYRWCS